MDLSQQELPLTAYFTRGRKETRSRTDSYKKVRPTEDSQSVARPSKRSRTNVGSSTASPLSSSGGQPKPRPTTLQLPTPATSARKRIRGGRLEESPGKTPPASTGVLLSSVEQNPLISGDKGLARLAFGPTLPKSTQLSCTGAQDAIPEPPFTPLALPSTGRRKTAKLIDTQFPPGNPRLSNHTDTGIATPRTSSPRVVKPVHGIDDHSQDLARSNCHLPFKSSKGSRLPDQGISHAVLPHAQLLARSTTGPPCSPVDLGRSDPFHTHEKNNVFVPRDGASASSKQYFIQSETMDDQPPEGHVIPMIPVPSSQSQYLLHLDATPKRKQCSRRIEPVISSQTQEERELTLPVSHKPAAMVSLSVGVSPGRHSLCGNPQLPRLHCSERRRQHISTPASTSAGSPIDSSAGSSRHFAAKKASDELLHESFSPLRCKRLTSCHSPSCKTKTPRGSARHDSIANIPLAQIEDSLTESESDSDMIQVPCQSPAPRDACSPARCEFAPGCPAEDDSATEAESDTEILHCVAEIGKQRPREYRSEVPREDIPPVISPLVSPTRPRIAAVSSTIGFTQFSMREGAGLNIPGSCASYPSSMGRPQIHSESLPSVVRDFIRMFPGDESYPADFPESLRI